MKTAITIAACILIGFSTYGQTRKNNPALDSLRSIQNPKALDKKLKKLGSGSADDLSLLLNYYNKSEKSRDSVEKIVLKRFPESQVAFSIRFRKAYAEKDPIVQEKYLLQLKADFPDGEYDDLTFTLAYNFADLKNAAKAIEYADKTKGRSRSMARTIIPNIVMEFDLSAAEAAINKYMVAGDLTAEERLSLLNSYSQIMDRKGNADEAFAAIKEYQEQSTTKNPEQDAYYYYLMSKTGAYKDAFPQLEKAIINGLGNEDMTTALKAAYVKLNPGKDAEVYISTIYKHLDSKNKKELVAQMISEPSPNFKVKDIDGKEVSLTDFAGKIIILDFWATWCGPCKNALPSMQLTVNKYKNDPNVKFLFIHTWEHVVDPKADAIKYLASKKFNLPLYMDVKDPNTRQNPAVSAFGIDGIPAKFVIDAKGNIRFKVSGFAGSDDSAVAELSAMIELSRQTS